MCQWKGKCIINIYPIHASKCVQWNLLCKLMTHRHTPTPLFTGLAGSTVYSLQCVAYITGVRHYRVVGCTGETALTICGSTRTTAGNGWED